MFCCYLVDMQVSLDWSEASKLRRWKTGRGGLSLVGVGGSQIEGSGGLRLALCWSIGGTGPPLKPRVTTEESVGREGGREGAAEDRLKSSGLL